MSLCISLPCTVFSHPCEAILTDGCYRAIGDDCLALVLHLENLPETNSHVIRVVKSVSKLIDPTSEFYLTRDTGLLKGMWQEFKTSFDKLPADVKSRLSNHLDMQFSQRLSDIAASSFRASDNITKSKNLWLTMRRHGQELPDKELQNQILDRINGEYGQSLIRISERRFGSSSNAHTALQSLLEGKTLSPSKLSLADALLENTLTIGRRDLGARETLNILFDLNQASPEGYAKILEGLISADKTPAGLVGHIYHAHVGLKLPRNRKFSRITFEQPVLEGKADLFVGQIVGVNKEANILIEAKAGLNFGKNSPQGIHFQNQLNRYFRVLNEGVEIEGRIVNFLEIHYPGDGKADWIVEMVDELNRRLGERKRIRIIKTPYPLR